jgi:hypothetical protein
LDGTFGVIDGYVLHILSVQVQGKSVPVLYAFLSDRTAEIYCHFLRNLKEKMGKNWVIPKIWHTDFEQAYKKGTIFEIFKKTFSYSQNFRNGYSSLSLLLPSQKKFSQKIPRFQKI